MEANDAAYRALADRLRSGGVLADPWLEDGRPRFREAPVLLSSIEAAALGRAAEAVAAVHDEVAHLSAADAGLRRDFLSLTPTQALLCDECLPAWHGLARADVFRTRDGLKICELNSDTPSGEAEAVLLNELCAMPGTIDPNRELPARFCDLLEAMSASLVRGRGPLTIGIVYPTDLVEDLSMIAIYRRWFARRGWRVAIGSPYNLAACGGGVGLFGVRCDVIVRHYKTDWWCEREPVWTNAQPYADAAPLAGPLATLLEATRARRCVVVNPFGAVVTQNKRAMAMMWEAKQRFSSTSQAAIEAYVPYTVLLERALEQVRADRAGWVLKSDYGCEGSEVIVGATTSDERWAEALALAVPGRWIAQRYFDACTDGAGITVNHGVYLVGGATAGFYSRVHAGATGTDALSAPTLVVDNQEDIP